MSFFKKRFLEVHLIVQIKPYDYQNLLAKDVISSWSLSIGLPLLKHVIEFKCLGVVFDKHLNWNKLVKAIVCKAFRQVDMLSHVPISINIVQN